MERIEQEVMGTSKRTSEEMVEEGRSGNAATQKKIKMFNIHSDQKPQEYLEMSKVLHVRNLPVDTTSEDLTNIVRLHFHFKRELIHFFSPFGEIEHLVLLKGKNQAFVQMKTKEAAQSLLNYYSTVPANIRYIFYLF